jgi:hypothetical protein
MSIILATGKVRREVDIGRIAIEDQPKQKAVRPHLNKQAMPSGAHLSS